MKVDQSAALELSGRRVLLVRRGKADSIPATLSVSYL